MTHLNKETHHDPSKSNDGKAISGELICKYCHAVYQEKHWVAFKNLEPKFIDQLKKSVCPACHMEKNHLSDGILHLTGDGFVQKKEEIKNLIENIAEKEEKRDIENRVERIEDRGDTMIIYTSKNQLAVEIGKRVADSHKGGKLDIKWSKGDKIAEVMWQKD